MSKKIFILFFMVFVMTGGFFFCWNHDWLIEKDIIYLKNGTIIDADNTWTKDRLIYYQKGWDITTLSENDVDYIGEGDARQKRKGSHIVKSALAALQSKLKKTSQSRTRETKTITNGYESRLTNVLPWILLLLILAATVKVVRLRIKSKTTSDASPKEAPTEEETIPTSRKIKTTSLSEQDKIALFFLNLYKLQIEAPDNASAEFVPIDSDTSGSGMIYELKVRKGKEWSARRMTIGEIGEESGSKSRCFYVIYNVHMVIKIPPIPINDFQVYIENIRKERQIVEKLAPRECIVPKISVIMKIVHQFHDEKEISWDKIEERYIRWLTNNEEKQSHLKIGDTFVYFMDLSKYFFLAHIIDNIHELESKLADEITKNPEIIWKEQEFTGRYGLESYPICQKLRHIYTQYEQGITNFFIESHPESEAQKYKIREWFLTHLSNQDITAKKITAENYPVDKLNILSEDILRRHSNVLESYHKIVKKQIAEKSFIRNKLQISSISSNLLELLSWLDQKNVAMRDLKPDNLIVAGEQEAYPHFLTSNDQFDIGLIDVETAVDMDTKNGGIDQPKLGGTPFYATPSQLFQNDLILHLFPDLRRILHLQDWYATIAMIYKVITGDTLFGKTAKHLVAFKTKLQKSMGGDTSSTDIIVGLNVSFWETAFVEFENKLKKHTEKLSSIVPVIPGHVKGMLHKEAQKNLKLIARQTRKYIVSQNQVSDEKQKKQLNSASHQQVAKLKVKWEEKNKPLADMLNELSNLKRKEEESAHIISLFSQSGKQLSALDLLQLMFRIVSNAMEIRG
jgi:serine/threonine protein kinase